MLKSSRLYTITGHGRNDFVQLFDPEELDAEFEWEEEIWGMLSREGVGSRLLRRRERERERECAG